MNQTILKAKTPDGVLTHVYMHIQSSANFPYAEIRKHLKDPYTLVMLMINGVPNCKRIYKRIANKYRASVAMFLLKDDALPDMVKTLVEEMEMINKLANRTANMMVKGEAGEVGTIIKTDEGYKEVSARH